MGNGPSVAKPKQIIDNINSSITNTIMNGIQQATSSVSNTQQLNMTCSEDMNNLLYDVSNIPLCLEQLTSLKESGRFPKFNDYMVEQLCKPPFNCDAFNITMKSSLNISDVTNQSSSVSNYVTNNISNNIQQNLKTNSTMLSQVTDQIFGSKKTKQSLENINTSLVQNMTNILQDVSDYVKKNQEISLYNYSANNITMDSVTDVINNHVQNNVVISSTISDITNNISQTLIDNRSTFTDLITKLFYFGLAGVGVFILFLTLLKKKNTQNFMVFILPYLIFFILLFTASYITYLIKPNFILITSDENTDTIDNIKFIMTIIVYAGIIGVIELAIYKIIQAKWKNPVKSPSNTAPYCKNNVPICKKKG